MEIENQDKNVINSTFFKILRAGLWEKEVQLAYKEKVDWNEVYQIAQEQGVTGLIAAGLEYIRPRQKVSQEIVLSLISETLLLEERNKAMNLFIADIVERMRKEGLCGLLVKGAGLAQCYKRPLWRSCGDIDFLFSNDEYAKAVDFFSSLEGAKVVQDASYTKSFGLVLEPWLVEVHGTLRNGLSSQMDREIDEVQKVLFNSGRMRLWHDGVTQVFLPGVNEDVFLVFVHFVRHFYKEGVNIRQICDWCRLLWTYHDKVDTSMLRNRLQRAGLIDEWLAFATFAVSNLGMPAEKMKLFSDEEKWKAKACMIGRYIIEIQRGSKARKIHSLFKMFPGHTFHFLPGILYHVNWMKIKGILEKQQKSACG